jgi:hypothetical protein
MAQESQAQQTITQIIEEQYAITEKYANSQSRLLNASMMTSQSYEDNDEVLMALKGISNIRNRVRSTFQRLEQDDFKDEYPDHVALSKRVIQTIANNPSWHAIGIPSHSASVLENNTVALAALKASIARVNEMESLRNELS